MERVRPRKGRMDHSGGAHEDATSAPEPPAPKGSIDPQPAAPDHRAGKAGLPLDPHRAPPEGKKASRNLGAVHLIPCPAAITVLLICMQLKQLSIGFVLVVCFSIGLALTLVSAGLLAALSVRHISRRWSGFSAFARRAPYASAALILMVGLYTAWLGWHGLAMMPHLS